MNIDNDMNIPNKSASNVPSIVKINEYTDDTMRHVMYRKKIDFTEVYLS